MRLVPGAMLGRYEIEAPLGSGGMGEVYRARDTRLCRPVAIKVLPESFAADPSRAARFEREARAVGRLNHPNILTVYDVGSESGSAYLVTELLDGHTLRDRLALSPLPFTQALDYAIQLATGLAAAHDSGFVHRDLKPENLFISAANQIKILDFGLAKPLDVAGTGLEATQTLVDGSGALGVLVGTASYMSPEQVRGERVDQRSDIFACGAVLYEMFTGAPAFKHDTAVETMHAIIHDDLPAWPSHVPMSIRRIVGRCVEKNPERRFQSAKDLGFALQANDAGAPVDAPQHVGRGPMDRRVALAVFGSLAAAAVGGAGFVLGRKSAASAPVFTRLTFRRGNHGYARFAPDRRTIIYTSWWEGGDARMFSTRLDSFESRDLGLADADILSISSRGEMAISLSPTNTAPLGRLGTLAVMPLAGGAPRPLLDLVQAADWSPDGAELAVVRQVDGRRQLEYPIGTPLYSATLIGSPRVSPSGDLVAFIEVPEPDSDMAPLRFVTVVDRYGRNRRRIGRGVPNTIIWSPDGSEILFSDTGLHAVSLSGRQRTIVDYPEPGWGHIQDISSDGRILLVFADMKAGIAAWEADGSRDRDLSWFSWSNGVSLSADGSRLLFTEGAYWSPPTVYMRATDGGPATRLGEGRAVSLSPDARWALARVPRQPHPLALYQTGAGQARPVVTGAVQYLQGGRWLPDGEHFLISGREPDRRPRVWLVSVQGEAPRPVTPEGAASIGPISPDGRYMATLDRTRSFVLFPLQAGEVRRPPIAPEPGELNEWSEDGRTLFVTEARPPHLRVFRRDLESGARELWKNIVPAEPAGVYEIRPLITRDARTIVYSYQRFLSNLYAVTGVQ
jgi:Tol biopolymer transport system component